MNIAIHVADLDASTINGSRVYLSKLLNHFGRIDTENQYHLYHRYDFHPELAPPICENYHVHKVGALFLWTQTRFAFEIWKSRPEKLFMPMAALPFIISEGTETTVTIHDLAFKYFPETFPKKDVFMLNRFADFSIRKADKIIAVSESTKKDILKFYPNISEKKIRVIYHGFDTAAFQQLKTSSVFEKFNIQKKQYLLYVGQIQPRKNLATLLDAFSLAKERNPEMQLVIAGSCGWLWKETIRKIEDHPFRSDIIMTGNTSSDDVIALYQSAKIFVFPSLYEGFGIPVLEAMAAGVPVICGNHSSLPEVGGEAVRYCDVSDTDQLSRCIDEVWKNESLQQSMAEKGKNQTKKFSWERCAQETMRFVVE